MTVVLLSSLGTTRLAMGKSSAKPGAVAAATSAAHIAAKDDALAIVHSALQRAYAAAGKNAQALEQAQWLAAHRGRVFVERGTASLLDPINLADTTLAHLEIAIIAKATGDDKRSADAIAQFKKAWPADGLPRPLRERVEKL